MSTDTVAQTEAREAWLVVAHAVMNGDIPLPDEVAVYPEHPIRSIDLLYRAYRDDSYGDAARAAEALGIPPHGDSGDEIRVWWANRDGWFWYIRAYRDTPPPLDSEEGSR